MIRRVLLFGLAAWCLVVTFWNGGVLAGLGLLLFVWLVYRGAPLMVDDVKSVARRRGGRASQRGVL